MCREARGHPEAAMVKAGTRSGARTSAEVAIAKSWTSSGWTVRVSRRAASIARIPSVPRKWVEFARAPPLVKVQAAAANTHDRNAQESCATCYLKSDGRGCPAAGAV